MKEKEKDEVYMFSSQPGWRHPKNNNETWFKWDDTTSSEHEIAIIANQKLKYMQ